MSNMFFVKRALWIFAILFLVGCITEKTGGPFKQPTAQEMQRSVSLYVQMAYLRVEKKEYEKAMSALSNALDIDSKSSLALTALAVTYQEQGEKKKAEKIFQQVISNDSRYTDAHFRYGSFLFIEKRYEEACSEFTKATLDDFFEKRSTAYLKLGECWRQLGKLDASEHAYERCMGLQPNNYPVLIELADLRFQRKDFPGAKKLFDSYSKLTRERGQILSARALWLGIQLERVFGNKDAESSLGLMLKNKYPYSAEYLEYANPSRAQ